MSETNAQEPTMEEILASIRRIISEDEQPAPVSAGATPPHGDEEADVLELTHRVEPTTGGDLGGIAEEEGPMQPTETVGDLDVFESAPTPANQTASAPAQQLAAQHPPPEQSVTPSQPAKRSGFPMREQPLVSEHAADAAASKFGALEETLQLDRGVSMPSGQTLDGVIRQMLNPLLQAWLDENLEQIVDAKVQAEIDRIARRR